MMLNALEKSLMNNPVRAAIQRGYEARRLRTLGGRAEAAHALEVGCGRGVGVEIILEVFGAARVDAFALDPHMVALARVRHASRADRTRFSVGDAEHIEAPDATYDAVFDFGILHHVPDWHKALREIHRVLKPGGTFYADDVYSPFLSVSVVRRLAVHPEENRFDHAGFQAAIRETGLEIVGASPLMGCFGFVVARKKT